MFFKPELLCRGGQFATIWVAATRGVRAISNTDMKNVNIVLDCEQILKFIVSNSNKPNQRFSLVLSSKLIHGICLLHRVQVNDVYDDIVRLLVHTPRTLQNMIGDVTSQMPRVKRKKPAAKKIAEVFSDDTDLQVLGEAVGGKLSTATLEAELQARILNQGNITLREVEDMHIPAVQTPEISELGPAMDAAFLDELMRTAETDGRIEQIVRPVLPPVDLDAIEVYKELPIVTAAPVAIPDEPLVLEPIVHVEPPVLEPIVHVEPPAAVQDKENVPPTLAAKFSRKKRIVPKSEAIIKIVKRSNISIDRTGDDEYAQETDPPELLQALESIKAVPHLKGFNLNFLRSRLSPPSPAITSRSRADSARRDLPEPEPQLTVVDTVVDTVPTPAVPSITRPDRSVASLQTISLEYVKYGLEAAARVSKEIEFVPLTESTPIVSELMPPPTSTKLSTPKRGARGIEKKRLGSDFPSSLVSIEEVADIQMPPQEVEEQQSLGPEKTDNEERLRQMVFSLKESYRKGEMPLTLQQISEKPLTPISVARAYNDVLSLHRMEYVELVTEEGSVQLRHIEAGRKLKII